MKLYIVKHVRKRKAGGRVTEDIRVYNSLSRAKGALTVAMNPRTYSDATTTGAVIWEADTDDLTVVEERGRLVEHVEGQAPLF